MKKVKRIDFCNSCNSICKQEEISEGTFGCEHCKSDSNISSIDVDDYVYEMEVEDDED